MGGGPPAPSGSQVALTVGQQGGCQSRLTSQARRDHPLPPPLSSASTAPGCQIVFLKEIIYKDRQM